METIKVQQWLPLRLRPSLRPGDGIGLGAEHEGDQVLGPEGLRNPCHQPSTAEDDHLLAEFLHLGELVADEEDCPIRLGGERAHGGEEGLLLGDRYFPGTTTAIRTGRATLDIDLQVEVVDLPGLYELNLDVPESAAAAAVQMGASAWSRDSNAAFAFAYAGPTTASAVVYDRINTVFFRNESSGSTIAVCHYWYLGSELLDADIMFYDGAFTFVAGTSGCSGGMFIEDVAAHEFGHALGLGHTNVSNATMYPSIPYCNQDRRYLDPDDVAGVEALYPPAGTPPTAPTNAQATTSGVSDPTSQVCVTWTDTSSNEDYFFVERSINQSTWMQSSALPKDTTSHVGSGLDAGTTYAFRVRANNSAGYSDYSNVASATTASAPPPATPPSTPSSPPPANSATSVNENRDPPPLESVETGR